MEQKQIKTKQFLTDDKFDTLARMRHFHLRHMGLCGRFFSVAANFISIAINWNEYANLL